MLPQVLGLVDGSDALLRSEDVAVHAAVGRLAHSLVAACGPVCAREQERCERGGCCTPLAAFTMCLLRLLHRFGGQWDRPSVRVGLVPSLPPAHLQTSLAAAPLGGHLTLTLYPSLNLSLTKPLP